MTEKYYINDHGHPEYLDGAMCRYEVLHSTTDDVIAYVYDYKYAEAFIKALNDL